MRKTQTSKIIVLGAFCCAFLTACGGGGGGGMSQSVSTGTSTYQPPPYEDTGIAGTAAAPAAATFGSTSPQLATPGGPTFDGASGSYPSNITFPLIIGGLQKTSTGLSPMPADSGATLTVISSSSNFSHVQLMIPSLGVNEDFTLNSSLASGDNGQPIYGLSYVVTGEEWARPSGQTNGYNLTSSSVYVFGFETPQAAMPTSGTAVFSTTGNVDGSVFKTVGTEIQTGNVAGDASISVNFGSGAINGMLQFRGNWNDVSVTANIATGSNKFNGSTAAASAPGTPLSLSASAVGKINGAFYGPAAQNLGAVWSLSDGTGSALGTVVAGH